MVLMLGLLIIAAAVIAVLKKVDVRLALFIAALALGVMDGRPELIVQKFLATLVNEQFVVPICTAMGFAYVVRHTGCDQHLVQLLVAPLRRVRPLLVPGAVLVGFLVNVPVVSQTSTAVCIGAVLIPLLLAARVSPVTIGAALLLGSSVGGELLNPGAPELRTVVKETAAAVQKSDEESAANNEQPSEMVRVLKQKPVTGADCVNRVVPLVFVQLVVATLLFWWLSVRAEKQQPPTEPATAPAEGQPAGDEPFRVNLFMAAVPLVPLVLLILTSPAFKVLSVPQTWLVDEEGNPAFESRLIGAAMLVGVIVATLTAWRAPSAATKAFFEGAGYAYTHIISLIVVASAFGEGLKMIGLNAVVSDLVHAAPWLLLPLAASVSHGFAWLSGSGMAATQSLFGLFAAPALVDVKPQMNPAHVGAVVSLAAAAGRTMSPVAAVTLICAVLTKTDAMTLTRRVSLPLLLGLVVVVIVAVAMAAWR